MTTDMAPNDDDAYEPGDPKRSDYVDNLEDRLDAEDR